MGRQRVLIVDDEPEIGLMLKRSLEETNKFEVTTETQGVKGLEVAKQFQPDLIILDFRMPDMHGSDVALQLQGDPATKDIPIIFLTGMATREELEEHGDGDMCNLILAKPSSTKQIISAIEANIGKRTSLGFLQKIFNKKKKLTWGSNE